MAVAGVNPKLCMSLVEMQAFYQDDKIGKVLELMNQTNDILNDIPWIEANTELGHKTKIRTKLPEVHFRRLYQGVPYSKGAFSQVVDTCSFLEARSLVDEAEVKLFGDKANAFRMSESAGFLESMRQTVATNLFYGNQNKTQDEFNGFAMRYPTSKSPNVLNAGGTGSNCTSVWFIAWGDQTTHGIYPKGSTGGLDREDLGRQTVQDDKGNSYEALVDRYQWRTGLTVRDWRSVVRICNIDTTKLDKRNGEEGFIDLQKLLIQARNLMPESMQSKGIWYMNKDVKTALELQSIDSKSVRISYGQYFDSKDVLAISSRPVRQCDVILNTETNI